MREFWNVAKVDKLADVFIALGQLFFGSTVLPFIIPGLDKEKLPVIVFGLTVSLIFWLVAVLIAKEKR